MADLGSRSRTVLHIAHPAALTRPPSIMPSPLLQVQPSEQHGTNRDDCQQCPQIGQGHILLAIITVALFAIVGSGLVGCEAKREQPFENFLG